MSAAATPTYEWKALPWRRWSERSSSSNGGSTEPLTVATRERSTDCNAC